ncbi:MAG: PilZ domain-containing protein [Terriglobales bacterium]
MSQERRQFPRLKIPEDTYAVDESFRQLGKVEAAGGGGLTIIAASEEDLAGLEPGRKLRLSIVEPAGHVLHTVEVVVRYRNGRTVGVEFVTGLQ